MAKAETKEFAFELKQVTDEGSFTGILSVYNVVDLGKDLVEPGAFTKTLQESGGVIPCLYRHEEPIGTMEVHDTGAGLEVKGQLVLDKLENGSPAVPDAFKALALMRKSVVRGMSIGFQTIKSQIVDGVRHLKELSLKEGSVVLFPMLPLAQITSVKEDRGAERKMTFDEALSNVQTFAARYQLMTALDASISSVLYDEAITTDDSVAQIAGAVQSFGTQMTDLVPKLRALMASTYDYDFKRLKEENETKAGRTISAASRSKIEEAIRQLRSLIDEADDEEGKANQSDITPDTGTETKSAEPGDHSQQLSSLIEKAKGALQWN